MKHRFIVAVAGSVAIGAAAVAAEKKGVGGPFDYTPSHTVGDLRISYHPQRFLGVAWKGRDLLTQGGQVFSRDYRRDDPNKFPGQPLGFYAMSEHNPSFDIPVRVEKSGEAVTYTWVCDAAPENYRHVNRAVTRPRKLVLTTTLSIAHQPPAEVVFHPVFFPGKQGDIAGKAFQFIEADGQLGEQAYPGEPMRDSWFSGNCRCFTAELTEGPVRVTFRSDQDSRSTVFYANAKWPAPTRASDQRGMVGRLAAEIAKRDGAAELTWEMVIEVGALPELTIGAAKPPQPVRADYLKLALAPAGRDTWSFGLQDRVACKLTLDNRWSAGARKVTLSCRLRDATGRLVQDGRRFVSVAANGTAEMTLDYGRLQGGAYAIEATALSKGQTVGYSMARVTVAP